MSLAFTERLKRRRNNLPMHHLLQHSDMDPKRVDN